VKVGVIEYDDVWDFVRNCVVSYDCDEDAHTYDTGCRACTAQALLDRRDALAAKVDAIIGEP
jgi:hypothetical protein